jgi:hypothetical protein
MSPTRNPQQPMPEKGNKTLSTYNIFMKNEIARLKAL